MHRLTSLLGEQLSFLMAPLNWNSDKFSLKLYIYIQAVAVTKTNGNDRQFFRQQLSQFSLSRESKHRMALNKQFFTAQFYQFASQLLCSLSVENYGIRLRISLSHSQTMTDMKTPPNCINTRAFFCTLRFFFRAVNSFIVLFIWHFWVIVDFLVTGTGSGCCYYYNYYKDLKSIDRVKKDF